MSRPIITRHYADGRPSETREMTELEFAQLTEELPKPTDETSSPA